MNTLARPRICLFAGPSLPAAQVHTAFNNVDADVTMLPPAEQGDLLRMVERMPDVIGIVDGQFFHTPSLLHREILLALEQGVRVLGAASIGALRAAELDQLGMEGVGEIYRQFRAGIIDSDDEVAVVHGDASEGFRALTEALVSIRHNLRRARRRGVISERAAAITLTAVRQMHFTRRTRAAVVAAAPEADRAGLARFLEHEAVDVKRCDAELLVNTIVARITGRARWPRRVQVRLNRTSFFEESWREYVGRTIGDCYVPDRLTLSLARMLSPSFPDLQASVARRWMVREGAAQLGLAPADTETLVTRFRRKRRLRSHEDLRAWSECRSLSPDELICTLRERDLEDQMLTRASRPVSAAEDTRNSRLARMATEAAQRAGMPEGFLTCPIRLFSGAAWSNAVIRELKFRGGFAPALGAARQILCHNAAILDRHPWLARARARRGVLTDLAARRWRVAAQQVDTAILDRGFIGYDDFREAAQHLLIYERTLSGRYRSERLADCFHVDEFCPRSADGRPRDPMQAGATECP